MAGQLLSLLMYVIDQQHMGCRHTNSLLQETTDKTDLSDVKGQLKEKEALDCKRTLEDSISRQLER